MTKLKNKVAVITGGSTGIGLASAKIFIQEGAKVIITGRTQSTLDQAVSEIGGENIEAIQSDTSKLEEIETLASQLKDKYGKIDVLFANAGVAWFAPIEGVDEAFYNAHFDINVKGLFFTIQKLLPIMNDGGSIVLNASLVAHKGFANASIYSATKAAVRSFARTLSAELVPRKIRVNVVSPGPIDTPIYGKMGMSEEEQKGMSTSFTEMVPIKRFGNADEVAKAALFLASEDSSFVVGEEILVDGGLGTI
ncbi:SDR family oxidoreductase [Roseivirga pacifica]|uniref:SDR family oxidoreductase n=1 Tax=Roseivirga pacifica TaxID=1267423 RepID=UPI002095AEED|nr:SDR family oxidoreductase [Roseivirga pacifica]MCO6358710.1 SDR family oxidoreductase [Roseivirga pacifica]MCO6365654.1 SDR family oxidoreductase [Roseivirga pacifica]MCO6371616.1 SDR family oxidoreductase [Roseivirga pacifica]MCO6376273.1 SDR family oxidoreductase [Roseivirga pacifica]MCO6378994.1 SDR family oxidoreductase [Roseivirga pacifica]